MRGGGAGDGWEVWWLRGRMLSVMMFVVLIPHTPFIADHPDPRRARRSLHGVARRQGGKKTKPVVQENKAPGASSSAHGRRAPCRCASMLLPVVHGRRGARAHSRRRAPFHRLADEILYALKFLVPGRLGGLRGSTVGTRFGGW